MKRISMIFASIVIALGSGGAIAHDLDTPVAVNTDHLQLNVARQVEKHAAEGYKSLARYMERTRPYHRLWFDDVTRQRVKTEPLVRQVAAREVRKHATEWRN